MKKLLTSLAIAPLALTACGGGGASAFKLNDTDIKSTVLANTEVQEAFKALIAKAKTDAVVAGNGRTNGWGTDLFGTSYDWSKLTIGQAMRGALYFGIDTKDIFEKVGKSQGTLLSGMLAEGVQYGYQGINPSFHGKEAKTVIDKIKAQTGNAQAYGIYQNAGSREDIALFFKTNAALLGVDIQLNTTDWPTHLEKTYAGEHSAYVGGWTAVTGHAGYGLWGPFHSSAQGSGGNRQFYNNPKFDEKLEEANWLSGTASETAYIDAQKIIAHDFPTIPLYSGNSRFAFSSSVFNMSETQMKDSVIHPARHHDLSKATTAADNATVKYGVTGKHKSLHPHGSNDSSSTAINKHIYQSLWSHLADGTYVSNLVTENINNMSLGTDGKLEVTIDTNVKWHDGTNITVAQVVDSINRALVSPEIGGVTPGVLGAWDAGSGKVAIQFGEMNDGYEVKNFDRTKTSEYVGKPFSAWKQTLAHAGFALNKIALSNFAETTDKVIGTGPYKLSSVNATTKDVVLVRADGNTTKKIGTLEFKVVGDATTQITAFKDGSIHFIDAVSYDNYQSLTVGKKADYKGYSNSFIGLNVKPR